MEGIAVDVSKNVVQRLVDLVINEANYLCCYKSYVDKFEKKKEILAAKHQDVKIDIEKASGVSRVKNEARQWAHEADNLIEVDTEIKKKWFFGLCPNYFWRYRRGKELAEKTVEIQELLGRCNFNIVAGPVDVPGIKYHSSQNFIHFESRKLKFQDLMEALEDENCNMIGLQGMGGTGKTSLAIEVGAKLEESKFDKVILLVVSKPPDFKKIQGDIARHLDLTLEEGKEEEHSKTIWSRITNKKQKLLLILDDVWEKFDLIKDIGIPSGHRHKGCSVLITTRNLNVCEAMGCQRTIHLQTLTDEDALNLFQANASINNSSSLKGVAQNIVKQCGGVPVAIVAVARTLKNRPSLVWKDALKTLEKSKLMLDVNENLIEAYKCLKLSYDNLKNEKAKELFLISSMFPEDFEIPIELLGRISIGVGLFGEVDKYRTARSKVLAAVLELIDSCLLLNDEEERVKMHDLVREVALLIANKDIQSIMDFTTTIKVNMRYLFWNTDNFPNKFDGTKLEVLLINVNSSKNLKVSNEFFAEMPRLKVLHLNFTSRISAPSLLYSLHLLKGIRSLFLKNLILGNISILEKLPSLETLELNHCSIIELPKEILELKKLILLNIRECQIEMSNPFEVIERCSQLEELYFFGNKYDGEKKDVVPPNVSPPTLQRYLISLDEHRYDLKRYGSISRYFQPSHLRHLVSEATFKQLVGTTEILTFGWYKETRWKNLIPDIVPVEDGGMNDLIFLHLGYCHDIQCLIDTRNYYSDVTAFSKLVDLNLSGIDVEDLYRGSLPSGFLEQLEIMTLKECLKLKSILFNGKLNLCHLKAMELENCPLLTSIFQPSTARSLGQLEKLIIKKCHALEYIIASGEEIVHDDGDNDENSYDSLFPKLKTLRIARCDKLQMILPVLFAGGLPPLEAISICECEKLKYIFDKYQEEDHVMLPLLKEMELCGVPNLIDIFREYHKPMSLSMQRPSSLVSRDNSKEKLPNLETRAFSCAHGCCFPLKSRATSEEANDAVSKERLLDHTIPQVLHASKKGFEIVDIAQYYIRQLFNFRHIKKMKLASLSSNLVSLFTLSIASMISWEELTIDKWDGLKHIITNEEDDLNDQINCTSIFPKLEKLEILHCKDLEFLFPSTLSGGLKNLKSLTINDALELKYVVGKYHHEDHLSNQNHNDELHFDLPTLEVLCLQDVPQIISICAINYYLVCPSLQNVVLANCSIKSFTDLKVCSDEGQLNWKTTKGFCAPKKWFETVDTSQCLIRQLFNFRHIKKMKLTDVSSSSVSLFAPSIASMISWEELTIDKWDGLKNIITNEADDHNDQINHSSIFPKLEKLEILHCKDLEFLFPSSLSGGLENLKSLTINDAPELKYVVKKYHHEDHLSNQNQNDDLHFDLPALEVLRLVDVPKIISICAMNYLPSLQNIYLVNCNINSFIDFTVCSDEGPRNWKTTKVIGIRLQILTDLVVRDSKIEEIFSLTHLDVEESREGHEPLTPSLKSLILQNLSELRNICAGPKYILSLNNLSYLQISACKKIKVVFSTSTLRSLPELRSLRISNCDELVHVIEEDYEENGGDHFRRKPSFPKLLDIRVKCCDSLKYLFSISMSDIFPKLKYLWIEKASELEHVMIRRGEMKETVMKDVFPELYSLYLYKLPSLVSVCHGIDFQTVESSNVHDCPSFSFYETTTTQLQGGLENLDSEVQAEKEEKLSSHLNTDQSDMGEAKGRQDLATQQSTLGSPNFTKGTKEATKETVEGDLISGKPKMATLSSESEFIGQLAGEEPDVKKNLREFMHEGLTFQLKTCSCHASVFFSLQVYVCAPHLLLLQLDLSVIPIQTCCSIYPPAQQVQNRHFHPLFSLDAGFSAGANFWTLVSSLCTL